MTTPIQTLAPRRHSRVLGLGAYRPHRVVDNEEIASLTGLDPAWILHRSGISQRRWAGPDEPLALMATTAAEKALAAAGVAPAEVGCVIVATITHLVQTPALAVEVAHRIGASAAAAFDVSAACAGFCHGLVLADQMIRLGSADHVLVIGAERMSDILDPHDRDTAFLFADGAGAAVVGPSDDVGIGPVAWRSDGLRSAALGMSNYWLRDIAEDPSRWPVIRMTGWKVFRWAATELAPAARRVLELSGVGLDDLDAFVPHQANMLITDHLVTELGLPDRVAVARDIASAGNTSAASIPLALDSMLGTGQARSGGLALLLGFGAGLVYAGQVVRLP